MPPGGTQPPPGSAALNPARSPVSLSLVTLSSVRSRLPALLRMLSAAALLLLSAAQIARQGPVRLKAPRTAVSRTQPETEGLILFLAEVALRVPRGASVAVLKGEGVHYLTPAMVFLLAVGQLPDHRVVPANTLPAAAASADYVALYVGNVDESGLTPVARIGRGSLYRAAP